MDAEWQPFNKTLHSAAILQVATRDKVFIIDVYTLQAKLDAQQGKRLSDSLFANPLMLKLGFGMREDFAVLARSLPGLEGITDSLVNALEIHTLWTHLKQHHSFMLPSGIQVLNFRELIPSTAY